MKKILLVCLLLLLTGCKDTEQEEVWDNPYCFEQVVGGDLCTESEDVFNDLFIAKKDYVRDGVVLLEPEITKIPLSEYIDSVDYYDYAMIEEVRFIERDYDVIYTGDITIQKTTMDVLTYDTQTTEEQATLEVRKFQASQVSIDTSYRSILLDNDYCMITDESYNNYTFLVDGYGYELESFLVLAPSFDVSILSLEGLQCSNQTDPMYEDYFVTYKTDQVTFMYKDQPLDPLPTFLGYYQRDNDILCAQAPEEFKQEFVVVEGTIYDIQEALDLNVITTENLYKASLPNCQSIHFIYHNLEYTNYTYQKEPLHSIHTEINGYKIFLTNYKYSSGSDFSEVTLQVGDIYHTFHEHTLEFQYVIVVDEEVYNILEALEEGFFTEEDLVDNDLIYHISYGFYSQQDESR